MRTLSFVLLFASLLIACSSTPQKVTALADLPEYSFPVSIQKLKTLSIQHAEITFQRDLKDRRLDSEEVSLRDYAYRYEGKTHPPLSYEVTRPWMVEKEFGKKEVEKSVEGPVDIVVDNPKRFILFYRGVAYLGKRLSDSESHLKILSTKPFDSAVEEVKPKGSNMKDPLYFHSLVLDLDRTLSEGTRNPLAEWEILNSVDPESAKKLGLLLGLEG